VQFYRCFVSHYSEFYRHDPFVLLLNKCLLLLLFISLWTPSGNFWIHPRILVACIFAMSLMDIIVILKVVLFIV